MVGFGSLGHDEELVAVFVLVIGEHVHLAGLVFVGREEVVARDRLRVRVRHVDHDEADVGPAVPVRDDVRERVDADEARVGGRVRADGARAHDRALDALRPGRDGERVAVRVRVVGEDVDVAPCPPGRVQLVVHCDRRPASVE